MQIRTLLLAGVAIAGIVAGGVFVASDVPRNPSLAPQTALIAPGSDSYRLSGQFLMGNRVLDAPLETYMAPSIEIMKYQVSGADYARCVADGACPKPLRKTGAQTAQTGVSFHDAVAYGVWLSKQTGQTWRLPSDREWSRAAGERHHDDALGLGVDDRDPSKRWLLAYESQTGREADQALGVFGTFGENEHGLVDVSGNIWEWTTGCYQRGHYSADGKTVESISENCGVRVAQGKHRAYIVDFIRDANVGGCAVGLPPDYLGFRLVRDHR